MSQYGRRPSHQDVHRLTIDKPRPHGFLALAASGSALDGGTFHAPAFRFFHFLYIINLMARIGAFEELVLLAVASLAGSGYGVTIRAELEAETGEAISLGAVYATLERLE